MRKQGPVVAWIVDDTGFPKKGKHSVGVTRQYCGQVGEQENCRVAVSLSVTTWSASLPISYRLYLPKDWAEDTARRQKAEVPAEIEFQTKPEIALEQIRQAVATEVDRGIVLADAAYGMNTEFREGLTELQLEYVVGVQSEAVRILSAPVYEGFGPTLAAEYLGSQHGIEVSKETIRQWMMRAQLWRGKKARVAQVHLWRPRRSRLGELVQWDTSDHDWLEGRGEELYLIAMIDDATSRLCARFVRHDSTEENLKLLWSYLERYGRPLAFYTDKASLFQTAEKHKRDEPDVEKDPVEMLPTQIGRALQELGIAWIPAHSAPAKGRVERNFGTAQDRLVKGLRVAGVTTLEQANHYLAQEYLVWWEREKTREAACPDDAHRPLDRSHNLAASLSHVETRQVRPDYTLRWKGRLYQVERQAIRPG